MKHIQLYENYFLEKSFKIEEFNTTFDLQVQQLFEEYATELNEDVELDPRLAQSGYKTIDVIQAAQHKYAWIAKDDSRNPDSGYHIKTTDNEQTFQSYGKGSDSFVKMLPTASEIKNAPINNTVDIQKTVGTVTSSISASFMAMSLAAQIGTVLAAAGTVLAISVGTRLFALWAHSKLNNQGLKKLSNKRSMILEMIKDGKGSKDKLKDKLHNI